MGPGCATLNDGQEIRQGRGMRDGHMKLPFLVIVRRRYYHNRGLSPIVPLTYISYYQPIISSLVQWS